MADFPSTPTSIRNPVIIPDGPWRYYQEWNRALFMHWSVAETQLYDYLPKGLTLDTFQGQAWVSVVPFVLQKARPRGLPSVPGISDFPELNLRTYVLYNGVPGVYFLAIEAGSRLGTWVAKYISGLPYSYSRIRYSSQEVSARHGRRGIQLALQYVIGERIQANALDTWLTERYAIHQPVGNTIRTYPTKHAPWQLKEASVSNFNFQYPQFESLVQGPPARVAYSEGVQVHAWDPY